jgi:hypothetical protein
MISRVEVVVTAETRNQIKEICLLAHSALTYSDTVPKLLLLGYASECGH